MVTVESPESWEVARKISELIKPVPSSITTCVHFLKSDTDSGLAACSPTSEFGLLRFLKSPSFKSPLYFAARTYRAEKMETLKAVSDRDLIRLFSPRELMVLTPLIYLYRKIRRGCDPQEFTLLDGPLKRQTDLGGIVGQAVPGIGFGPGILAGAMRYLGLAMLLGIDKANFIKYRRKMKLEGKPFDLDDETTLFGTNHIQIASLLTQPLGLGQSYGDAVARGLAPATAINQNLPPLALAVQVGVIWIEALVQTSKVPQIMMKADHYPSQADLQNILKRAEEIYNQGSPHDWLEKGKSEISPEKTPELYTSDSSIREPQLDVGDESVPQDLINQINPDDLEKLE